MHFTQSKHKFMQSMMFIQTKKLYPGRWVDQQEKPQNCSGLENLLRLFKAYFLCN